jgi:hypothetical protein
MVESIGLSQAGEAVAGGADAGVSVHHFDQLSVLGKGGFGKVLLVRKCDTKKQFAMKILLKSFIIEKQEVEHTKVERDILKEVDHPFLVKLHYAFQTTTKLYLIVDFVSGGRLATFCIGTPHACIVATASRAVHSVPQANCIFTCATAGGKGSQRRKHSFFSQNSLSPSDVFTASVSYIAI